MDRSSHERDSEFLFLWERRIDPSFHEPFSRRHFSSGSMRFRLGRGAKISWTAWVVVGTALLLTGPAGCGGGSDAVDAGSGPGGAGGADEGVRGGTGGALQEVPGTTWHVSPQGNDANDGKSLLTAFRNIQRGADAAEAGDMVLVHAGIYRERVIPPRGGTDEKFRIIYRAAPGDKVVMSGLEPWDPGNWKTDGNLSAATPAASLFRDDHYVDGGNPFKIAYAMEEATPRSLGQVVVNGEEWEEQRTKEEANAKAKSWWVDRTTSEIYINFDGTPAGKKVEIVARRGLFRPYTKGLGYITVQGFDFEYCGNNAGTPGVAGMNPWYQSGMIGTRQGHHWNIIDNRIRRAKGMGLTFGIGTDMDDRYWWDPHGRYTGDAETPKAQSEIDYPFLNGGDNETDEPYSRTDGQLADEPSSQLPSRPFKEVGFNIIAGNVFEGMGMNAIASIGSSGNTIYGNRFANNARFISESSAEDAEIKVHMQQGLLIENNLFEDFVGDHRVIWLDNNVVGTVVSRNVIVGHRGSAPVVFFEIASSMCQYLSVVDNNLFIDNDHGVVGAVADGVAFYHNLFLGNGDGFAMGSERDATGGDCGNMRIHSWNNLFVGQERAFGFGYKQAVNFHTSDYNLLHLPADKSAGVYLLTQNGTGDGGNRAARPWCTTDFTMADINAAKDGGTIWSCDESWDANNGPRGCEADLQYWRGTMGSTIDVHSEERPAAAVSHDKRTISLELKDNPALAGAPAKNGARLDFNGKPIATTVKAGPFQDLGATKKSYTFWNDDGMPQLPAPPKAPTVVTWGNVSDQRIRVTWKNEATDARFIQVERRVDDGPWVFWGFITTSQNFLEDYDLPSGRKYEYRVAARNAGGISAWVEVKKLGSAPAVQAGDCTFPGQ